MEGKTLVCISTWTAFGEITKAKDMETLWSSSNASYFNIPRLCALLCIHSSPYLTLLFYSLTSLASHFKTLLLIYCQFCKTFTSSQAFRAIFSDSSLLPSTMISETLPCCHTNVHLALLSIPPSPHQSDVPIFPLFSSCVFNLSPSLSSSITLPHNYPSGDCVSPVITSYPLICVPWQDCRSRWLNNRCANALLMQSVSLVRMWNRLT